MQRLLKVAAGVLLALTPVSALAVEQSPANPEVYRVEVAQISCQPRKTCGKIRSCQEARWYMNNCSWGGRLDGDSDGAPCERLCGSNN
ncbi:MAG: excalibur calcium-binding domain-containing protein [Devosia sp.]